MLYRVAKGVACEIRRKKPAGDWRPFVTRQALVFTHGGPIRGMTVEFIRAGWVIRFDTRHVVGPGSGFRPAPKPADPVLLKAQARAMANQPRPTGAGEVSAPGSGVDEWRDDK